ncbi:MAG: hypothetical protein O2894_11185 [Planctomycetota bacterium]|nr:hypothetical protein [Planctomycetota bacterium]
MRMTRSQYGGILGGLLGLLLLATLLGGGWWWFFGRFALPSAEPTRPDAPRAVLDYEGRRDLGLDPFDEMVRPDPRTGRDGVGAALGDYTRWFTEYAATLTSRAAWRLLDQAGALAGADGQAQATDAHITYLHHAQLAEYYRARFEATRD